MCCYGKDPTSLIRPFDLETYGGLGRCARKLIKQIASVAEDRQQMVSEWEVKQQLDESVVIAVQRGDARIILAEYYRAMSAAARGNRGSAASAA